MNDAGVSGMVMYYIGDHRAVPSVDVLMQNGSGGAATQTAFSGQYELMGMSPGDWELCPVKMGDSNSAVSALDAAHVLQNAVGMRTFSAAQKLACDVTGNGSVSSLDAARILQFVVGTLPRFPVAETCGTDWVFIPAPAQAENQLVVEPYIQTGMCQLGGISLNPLTSAVYGQDFQGVLFGDCTGNWQPDAGSALRRGNDTSATVHVRRPRQNRSGKVKLQIAIRAEAPFNALELGLVYDAARLELVGAKLRKATPDAIVTYGSSGNGVANVVAASGYPLGSNGAATLILEFDASRSDGPLGSIDVFRAQIDEQPASIVNHGTRRQRTR